MFQLVAKIELSVFSDVTSSKLVKGATGESVQVTVKSPITFSGRGLHAGNSSRVTIRPAMAEHGIWFRRTDIEAGDNLIPARWDVVRPSPLCTTLENAAGASVGTVEHIMAALAGCGVHNALIEIDGSEVPILDGSAVPFVRGIMQKGLRRLAEPVRAFEVLRTLSVSKGDAKATLAPSEAMRIDFHIDFGESSIGRQSKSLTMSNGSFARELSSSRTFCRWDEVERMQARGLALGGASGVNAVVFDGDQVVSPGGLRHADEPVRHKMLDALGDLALAGAPLIGHYTGVRAGHALTNELLRLMFTTPNAVRMVTCDLFKESCLPGFGLVWDEIPDVA